MTALPLPSKRLLTSEEAADYCGFSSVGGFTAYINVRPVKFGKNVRYDRADLDAAIDALRNPTRKRGFAELAGNENTDRGA